MIKPVVAAWIALSVAGCASQRINENAAQLGPNLASVQYDQIKAQLSKSIDDPYTLPSFSFIGSGTVTSSDSISASLNRAASPSGITRTIGLTLGASTNSFSYAFATVADVDALQRVRDIYAYTVLPTAKWQPWFDNLTIPPPRHGWLQWDLQPSNAANWFSLGQFGRHSLWTDNLKTYNDFSLAVLSAARTAGVFKSMTAGKPKLAPRARNEIGPSLNTSPGAQGSSSLAPGPKILFVTPGGQLQ